MLIILVMKINLEDIASFRGKQFSALQRWHREHVNYLPIALKWEGQQWYLLVGRYFTKNTLNEKTGVVFRITSGYGLEH